MEYLIIFVLGFYCGKKLHDWLFQALLLKVMKDMNLTQEDLEALIKERTEDPESEVDEEGFERIEIRIEQHSNTLYAFRKDNDQFLGQGATKEDLVRRLAEKMNNVRLVISKEDGGEFIGANLEYNVKDGKIRND